ncbi:MAG: Rap1a/Tai family immunity protein [Pseudomonadota bacterium]
MRDRFWVVAALSLLVVTSASAEDEAVIDSFELSDAQALVTACTVPEGNPLAATANGFCLGYMTGAIQLYAAAAASPNVENQLCPGRVVSRSEMRRIFLDWAAAHPERLDEPAIDGLARAAVAAFPCT